MTRLLLESDVSSNPTSQEQQTLFEACVEAGRFDAAEKLVHSNPKNLSECPQTVARLMRRKRDRGIVQSASLIVRATQSWLSGNLQEGLDQAEAFLQKDPADVDALLVKAWVLRDQGFPDLAEKALDHTNLQDPWGLLKAEVLSLKAHIRLDKRDLSFAPFADFRRAARIPNLPDEGQTYLDFLELSLAWRFGHGLDSSSLLELANRNPLATGYRVHTNGAVGEASNQAKRAVRDVVTEKIFLAVRGRDLPSELLMREAIFLAEPHQLAGPFLDLAAEKGTLLSQLSDLPHSPFRRRLLDLMCEAPLNMSKSISKRELLVMRLYSSGRTSREIADHLGLSPDTVKSHSHHVISKLKVGSRSEAEEVLRSMGLITT